MGLFSKLKSSAQSYSSGPPPYSESPSNNYPPPSPQRNINPDQRALPKDWISQYHADSGRYFYVYTPLSLRQWEHPIDRPLDYQGDRNGYQRQQPYQQPAQQYPYTTYQQPMMQQQSRFGGNNGYGKMAAAGLGGGLVGFMLGDAIGEAGHPDVNYYDNDYNNFDGGGYDGGFDGGFDGGGFDQVGF